MPRSYVSFVLLLALPFCCAASAFAQTEPVTTQAPADTPPNADAALVENPEAASPQNPDAPPLENAGPPPEANPVEADAQAYTRLVIRHDSLVFKEGMRTLTPAEANEMPGLRARGAEIQAKYAPGGPMAAQAASYQGRVKELSDTVVAAARRGWIADAFPAANTIVGAYPTDAERRAALLILRDLLDFEANPLPPSGQQKRTSYMRALDQIMPPTQADADLLNATREHTEDPQFRLDVVNKFVPAFAVEAENLLVKTQYEDDRSFRMNRYWTAYGVSTVLVMLSPFLYVVFGQHQKAGAPPNPNPAFQLPRKLSNARTWFQTYGLTYDCGRVMSTSEADHTLQTPDGRHVVKRMGPGPQQGDVMGVVSRGGAVVGCRNHTQGGGRFWGVSARLPIDRMVWYPLGILVGVYALINYFLYPTVEDIIPGVNSGLAATAIVVFLYLYFVVGSINTWLWNRRENKFDDKWEDRLDKFMDSRGPMLEEIYKRT